MGSCFSMTTAPKAHSQPLPVSLRFLSHMLRRRCKTLAMAEMDKMDSLATASGLAVAFVSGIALMWATVRVLRSGKPHTPDNQRRSMPPLYNVPAEGPIIPALADGEISDCRTAREEAEGRLNRRKS